MSARFRQRNALHQHSLHFGPNMTPMVDVVMVLLVFFMASAMFLGPEWFLKGLVAQAVPPTGAGSGAAILPDKEKPRPIEIVLEVSEAPKGVVATGLERTRVTLAEMIDALRARAQGEDKSKLEVLIRPAANVPIQDVVRLHEECERMGLQRVGYAGAR